MTDACADLLGKLAVVVILCALVIGVWIIIPDPVHGDYKHAITVDKSEKIETAVSNVLDCLAKRDFVPIGLSVTRGRNGTYTVRGSGIDRGNLLNLD